MAGSTVALLDRPDRVRAALSPIRRRLLERLRTPASATELAAEMAMGRQRVNYHLRELEKVGLLHLVEERQRRGCVERILAARADAFVVDPAVVGARAPSVSAEAQDRYSAEHLIDTAASVVRNVARMRGAAQAEGTRLLTFTADTDIAFASPQDFDRFTTALAEFVARQASQHHASSGGRRYRVLIAAHPSPSGAPHGRPRHRRNSHRRAH